MNVREAVAGDALALRDGNLAMAAETESLALDPMRLLRGVEAVLADATKGFYLVVEDDDAPGRIVGQLMITFEWSDWRNGLLWWIQSVHVAPTHRRRGVYRALHTEVMRRARAANVAGVRLYVHASNTSAQATYVALGMHDSDYRVFEQLDG